jgi:uncharacterized protein (DUF2147 family)
MKKMVFVQLCGLLLMSSSAFGADADRILGLWSTPGDESRVEIFKCGNKYCGRITELKEPNYTAEDKDGIPGQPILDSQNPNPHLRNHPLLGLQLMEGFGYAGGDVWEGGKIYNPDNGKSYKCKLTLAAPNRLEVRGFIGFSLFGRTSVWNR